MSDSPITPEELAQWKALADAATPGPWSASHRHVDCTPCDDEQSGLGLEITGPIEASLRGQFARAADAQLIAASRDAVPRLVAEVERLRAWLETIAGGQLGSPDANVLMRMADDALVEGKPAPMESPSHPPATS